MKKFIIILSVLLMLMAVNSNAQETYELIYATYLGGSGGERAYKVDTDELGNLYIFGETSSSNFPTTSNALDRSLNGLNDAFLVKVNPTGELLYSSFIGGTNRDSGMDMVVKSSQNVFLLGQTRSDNFPISTGAYRTIRSGIWDTFVMKMNEDLQSVAYSTFFYGSQMDVDTVGNLYTVTNTNTSTFPTTEEAYSRSLNGITDLYIAKLNTEGNMLVYGTYLGGSSKEGSPDIVVDDSGYAYVTSSTYSSDFPTTSGAFDTTFSEREHNAVDLTVTKLNKNGTNLIYSTYLGGEGDDRSPSILIDESGYAYISAVHLIWGRGYSDFPTTPDAYDTDTHRHYSAVFTKLNPSGSSLVYSTFFGGAMSDRFDIMSGCDFALDSKANVYFAGNTYIIERTYPGFPIIDGAYKQTYNYPAFNTFLSGINASGTDLVYSTMLHGDDHWLRITIDNSHNIYVVSMTKNADLPTTENALDRSYNGEDLYSGDIYIIKFAPVSTTDINDASQVVPGKFQLYQNYPNPFNPSTTIRFTLQKFEHISLKVYNVAGKEVAALIDDVRSPGEHQVSWQADGLPSGIYLARLQAAGQVRTMKLVLQK